MKNLLIICMILFLAYGCVTEKDNICSISGEVTNFDEKELLIRVNEIIDTIKINDDKTFSFDLELTSQADGYVRNGSAFFYVYLVPGKSLVVTFDGEDFDNTIEFAGELGLPAQYLHEKYLNVNSNNKRVYELWRPPNFPEYKRVRDSLMKQEYAFLNKYKANHKGLSRVFYKWDKKTIEYNFYTDLYRFPHAINPKYREDMIVPDDWYEFMDSIDLEDPSYLRNNGVRWLPMYYVAYKAINNLNISNSLSGRIPDYVREAFSIVKETFSDTDFYDIILHYFLSDYMEYNRKGILGIEDLIDEYLNMCQLDEYKQHIQELKDKWEPVAGGGLAPDFFLPDEKGNNVSLSDFRGKYVFIDFWFTACGPCQADLPLLIDIIEEFKKRNIVFLSISVDKDKAVWEQKLKEGYNKEGYHVQFDHKPNWFHLHDPQIREVARKYMVTRYPTYILIDPDGKFVNANCPRPSRGGLRELLNAQVRL